MGTVVWQRSDHDSQTEMAETMIRSLRQIGVRVWVSKDGKLWYTPKSVLRDYDIATINELEKAMVSVLKAESL